MSSKRSKIVKLGIKTFHPRVRKYELSAIPSYRRRFDKAMKHSAPVPRKTVVEKTRVDGVKVEWIKVPDSSDKTIIYIHGGGFVLGSPRTHLGLIANIAKTSKTKALAIDYSLAPENPYPVALNEIEKVWLSILKDNPASSDSYSFVGDSAGAHLVLTSVLRLRDKKLPLPGCIVLISPALNTSINGKTMSTNAKKDPLLNEKIIRFLMDAYVQDNSLEDPYASPLKANLSGLPPILVHVGSEEVLLSDSKELIDKAKKHGVKTKLFVGDGMWHDWHMFSYLPEAKSAIQDVGKFIQENTAK